MANAFIEELLAPVSDDQPCGPDLDLEGDPDFLNFLARVEGMLPGTFFVQDPETGLDRPYAKGSLNFAPEIAEGKKFLDRSRDLRILADFAIFAALDQRVDDFADVVEAMARLIEARWDHVNPREQDDQFALRIAALQPLDDFNLVILPLQFAPLIRHPRVGAVSFRNKRIAEGAPAKEGEAALHPADVARAFRESPQEEVAALRDRTRRIVESIASISRTTNAHLGADNALDLRRVGALSEEMLKFLNEVVGQQNPSAAEAAPGAEDSGAGPTAPAGAPGSPDALSTLGEVAAALAGVIAYFERAEPSSPALLLLKQAEKLVGRNFIDVMRVLAPDQFDRASFSIGRKHMLDLPVQRLAEQFSDEAGERAFEAGDPIAVGDRNAALAVLLQVEAYYGRREPSSPIPFLCERARKHSASDFLTILREILPEDALKFVE